MTGDAKRALALKPLVERNFAAWEEGWTMRPGRWFWWWPGFWYRIGKDDCGLFEITDNFEGTEMSLGDEAHPDTCVVSLYTNYVLGIVPLKPGFRALAFNPMAADLIDSASGEVPTPLGVIKAAWWHEGGKLQWKARPPPGTRCEAAVCR